MPVKHPLGLFLLEVIAMTTTPIVIRSDGEICDEEDNNVTVRSMRGSDRSSILMQTAMVLDQKRSKHAIFGSDCLPLLETVTIPIKPLLQVHKKNAMKSITIVMVRLMKVSPQHSIWIRMKMGMVLFHSPVNIARLLLDMSITPQTAMMWIP